MKVLPRLFAIVLCVFFVSSAYAQQSGYGQTTRSGANKQNARDSRSASPASAYAPQRKEKERRDKVQLDKLRICDLSATSNCKVKYSSSVANCETVEARCRTYVTDDTDASCTKQLCELEKAMCLADSAGAYESCLKAVMPE